MTLYRVFGAAVRGPDHTREGLPCQDAWAFGPAGEEGIVVCLSDGAGSAAYPEVGARLAASSVIEALRDLPPGADGEAALRAAAASARGAVLREAEARAVSPNALACTLIAVLAAGDQVLVAHLGDGAVIGQRGGAGEAVLLSGPDRGEYVNETWFVTSSDWQSRLRVSVHDGLVAFCAMTDGCQDAALTRGRALAPYGPFCDPLFAYAGEVEDAGDASAEVARLLDGEALRRASGDDKTLVLARRRAIP